MRVARGTRTVACSCVLRRADNLRAPLRGWRPALLVVAVFFGAVMI
jgi:hypothetical protein